MGLFDTVLIEGPDPRFVCSEGHDVSGEDFQTKCFGSTMGSVSIVGDAVTFEPYHYGEPIALEGPRTVNIYASCRECPAFVQEKTANLVDMWIEFAIDLVDARAVAVRRVSKSAADWLKEHQAADYMRGAAGPMPWKDAAALHQQGWPKAAELLSKGKVPWTRLTRS